MSVTLDRKALNAALDHACHVAWTHGTKPILRCARLCPSASGMHVSATNLEMSLNIIVPVLGGSLPECAVNAASLHAAIRVAKSATVALDYDERQRILTVTAGATKQELPCEDLNDFPRVQTEVPAQPGFCADAQAFANSLSFTMCAASKVSTRYANNSVLLERNGTARLVATDGRRLAVSELHLPTGDDSSTILPLPFCATLLHLLAKEQTVAVTVVPTPGPGAPPTRIYAKAPTWLLVGDVIDGHFPRWRLCVTQPKHSFTFDRRQLMDAIQAVSVHYTSDSRGVVLDLSPDQVTCSCMNPEGATATATVPTLECHDTTSLKIGFQPKLLLDALWAIQDGGVRLSVDEENRPGVLCAPENPDDYHLIMSYGTALSPATGTAAVHDQDVR